MQHVDLATVKASKANDRRSLAILAYDNATADPDGANWRAVADILRLAMPAAKAKPAAIGADSAFAPWADYVIPQNATGRKLGKSPVVVVTLADGEVVRAPAVSMPGKPINIGLALRVAIAFYECRIARRFGGNSDTAHVVAVPSIVSVICENTGAEYDAADCSARTANLRAGSFDYRAATAAATGGNEFDRGDSMSKAFRVAVLESRRAADPVEYTNDDRALASHWIDTRPAVRDAICGRATLYISTESAFRMAWAVMTFWPDLADSELAPNAPAEDVPPPVAEAAAPAPATPSEIPAAIPLPVAPSFRVPSRFLETSRLNVIPFCVPVAPSRGGASILQVA